jgi:cysteinyl-tRNA synthetase
MEVDQLPDPLQSDRMADMQAQFEALVRQGAAAMAAEHGYVRSDPVSGARLSEEDERQLQYLLLQRVFSKRVRDFQTADQLRARLKEAGVSLNDGEKTYSIRPPPTAVPNHHGYSRADDGSVIMSEADQATLDGLLLQRVVAKRARDFALADQLRRRLREAGVLIDDTDSTYRIAVRQQPAHAAPALSHHGYTRADDGSVVFSPADQATLDRLVLERVRTKRERDFGRADELQRQLLEAGVLLDDVARTYRLQSSLPAAAVAARGPGASLPTDHGYTRAEEDGGEAWRGLTPDKQVAVERMLCERVTAKRCRQFDVADALRAQLSEAGVFVDDKARVYRIVARRLGPPEAPTALGSADGGKGRASDSKGGADEPEWTRDPLDDSGVVIAAADQAMLVSRLGDRRAAQRAREYAAADAIRDELRAVAKAGGCLLLVDDKEKTFRFAPAPVAPAAETRNPPAEPAARGRAALPTEHGYSRRKDEQYPRELSQSEQEDIDRLLLERVIAKRTRHFDLADEIRSRLQAAGCYVDDKALVYSVRAARPAEGPPVFRRDPEDTTGTELTLEQVQILERQLAARWQAQREWQFELADRIRVELRRDLNVVINGREKMWRILPPSQPEPSQSAPTPTQPAPTQPAPSQVALSSVAGRRGREAAGAARERDGGAARTPEGVVPVATPDGGPRRGLCSPESYRDSERSTPGSRVLLTKRGREALARKGGGEQGGKGEGQHAGAGSGEGSAATTGGAAGGAGVDEDESRAAPRRRLSAEGDSEVKGGVAEQDQSEEDDIVAQILYGDD